MITAILGAIAAIPKIADAFEKLLEAVNLAWFKIKKAQAEKHFDEGAKKAQKDKNTCELEQAFDPDKKC